MNIHEYSEQKFYVGGTGLTFDDVLILPNRSDFIPNEVDTSTYLTQNIRLNVPVLSAAMDTVTDSRLAIAIAQLGGMGIIHKNFTIDQQVNEVRKVKRFENIIIEKPYVIRLNQKILDAKELMLEHKVSGIPVVDEKNLLQGIVTRRDLEFFDVQKDGSKQISKAMTPMAKLVTYIKQDKVDLKEAAGMMRQNRVEKLPITDSEGYLLGLITLKDITKIAEHPRATKDKLGRLRVGAAVSTGAGEKQRVEKLIGAGVDVVVVDTAHGHSKKVIEMVEYIRSKYPNQNIIAGNIATGEAALALIKAGANAVKVGIGPGSICTTRVVAGVGVPQISAIMDVYVVAREHSIPVIADGGIKYSGDIAKAIAAGANVVMLGNLFAGTTESPGEFIIYQGRRFKAYRGMGSLGAMVKGSKSRYFQDDYEPEKLVPEGIEGRVPYKGDLKDVLYQLVGGLRSSMGYCGASTLFEFKNRSKFVRITQASLVESHPHDVVITKESPNYTMEHSPR